MRNKANLQLIAGRLKWPAKARNNRKPNKTIEPVWNKSEFFAGFDAHSAASRGGVDWVEGLIKQLQFKSARIPVHPAYYRPRNGVGVSPSPCFRIL